MIGVNAHVQHHHSPVLAADGNTYERSANEQWFTTNDNSPLTNATLPNKMLVPNLALRVNRNSLMEM
jgi:hypothetical protein